MTPNLINSSNDPFGVGSNEDHHHQFFVTHHHPISSSPYSCHFHFNSTQDHQPGYYFNELYQSQRKLEGEEYVQYGGSYESENKVGNGLKLSQDHRVEKHEHQIHESNNQAHWMSSKMRLKQKMKSNNEHNNRGVVITTIKIREDNQKQTSETDYSGNNSSNTPVRVCSDCNTTKTPLWRSGPKGPKSLCNACGIRQRKARRAMAAAAAAAAENDTPLTTIETPTMKMKVQHHKEKTKNNGNALTVPFKKRCKVTPAGSSSQEPTKKLGFEDHLINLSKKLAFHHVFPQDEKEAAILLMALSCGLVHG